MKQNKKSTIILVFIEKWIPIILGIIAFFIIYKNDKFNLNISTDTFDKLLDSIINFTSILIGFIGVLLGILFSIKNEDLVIKLFNHRSREKLKQYFVEAFIAGLFLISVSIVLYIRVDICILNINTLLYSLWGGLIIYTILCGIRIIRIMILIVFNKSIQDTEKKDTMATDEKKQLQEKYKK